MRDPRSGLVRVGRKHRRIGPIGKLSLCAYASAFIGYCGAAFDCLWVGVIGMLSMCLCMATAMIYIEVSM